MTLPGRRLLPTTIGAALIALTLAAASARADGAVNVTIQNFDFSPMAVTVARGTTVTWRNLDEEPHTVVGVDGSFRSGALDQADTFSMRFDRPGVYKYVCSIHPKMTASITVK